MVMIQRKIPHPLHSVGWLAYPAAPVRGNLSALFAVKVPLQNIDARPMRVRWQLRAYFLWRLSLRSPLCTDSLGWLPTLSKVGEDMLEWL